MTRSTTGLAPTVLLIAAVVTAVVVAPFGGPPALAAVSLFVVVCLIAMRDLRSNVAGYFASLALQVSQSFVLLRFAVSDLFVLAIVVRTALQSWRRGEPLPKSTLFRPFALVLLAMTIALVVGITTLGRPTAYVLVNRFGGLVFLVVGYVALASFLRSPQLVHWAVRWFIVGVGVSNAAALLAVVAALAGNENGVFFVSTFRLMGWVANPSLYGGILMTAAMLELGLLTTRRSQGDYTALRWVNVVLMGVAMALTLSRSTWLASSLAAGALLAGMAVWGSARIPQYLAVATFGLLPAFALAGILNVNLTSGIESLADRTTTIQATMAEAAAAAAKAAATEAAAKATATEAAAKAAATEAAAEEAVPAAPPVIEPIDPREALRTALSVGGSIMNARGLLDRTVIMKAAFDDYLRNWHTIAFGIGLGVFYATSASLFGTPLIIHNTFMWFLVELGPLGLFALLWVWFRSGRNLLALVRIHNRHQGLALGLASAFVGMSAFWLINEGFYQRHFWLVMLMADRLYMLRDEQAGSTDA